MAFPWTLLRSLSATHISPALIVSHVIRVPTFCSGSCVVVSLSRYIFAGLFICSLALDPDLANVSFLKSPEETKY